MDFNRHWNRRDLFNQFSQSLSYWTFFKLSPMSEELGESIKHTTVLYYNKKWVFGMNIVM